MDREFLVETIRKLKNDAAVGPDGVHVKCLKFGGLFILDALEDLVRTSLDGCSIPGCLKLAWISGIWKGVDKESPADYRPISLTSHVIKVIERVVRHQMVLFLEVNSLH